jgi:formate/nitrite transporter FocA (FNT family)
VSRYVAACNFLWVTLGNALAGAMFMGAGYWRATPQALTEKTAPVTKPVEKSGTA